MVDKHVVKMILEYVQLLCTAHQVFSKIPLTDIYRATHMNHPSAKWVRESKSNYMWLYGMYIALLDEYTHRYKKIHACTRLVLPLKNIPAGIPDGDFTEPPPAMPDEYKVPGDSIRSYKNYYNGDKRHIFKWTKRPRPGWCLFDNSDIMKTYKVKFCGGIRRSRANNLFVLIINSSVNRYDDHTTSDRIDYEGEYIGLAKTQTMTRNNKSLNEFDGICHVYKKVQGTKYYEYLGGYVKCGEARYEPNKYGGQKIVFPYERLKV